MGKYPFQILISTMQNDYGLLDRMNVKTAAVVINQTPGCTQKAPNENNVGTHIKWIDVNDRGLSKSRNMAIKNSESEICLLADDDELFSPDVENNITAAFNRLRNADIIAFQVHGIEKIFKTYSSKQKGINFFSAMKISSVQIAFKKESIEKKEIRFDERFGAGSKYIMGEENIFLTDCLRKGLKIYYVPEKIADLHMTNSSWFIGFNKRYFLSRGAMYYRMSKYLYAILILYFSFHFYKKHRGQFKLSNAIRWMFEGAKECKTQS